MTDHNTWMLLLEAGTRFEVQGLPDPETAGGDEQVRELWGLVRDDFMADWIVTHPGSRPWAWWRYDAPELRQRTDGGPHLFDDPEYKAEREANLAEYPDGLDLFATYYGLPQYSNDRWGAGDDYETEAAYLDRLGLLTDLERASTSTRAHSAHP